MPRRDGGVRTAGPPRRDDRRATTTLPRHSARRGARFIFGFVDRPPDGFDARRRGVLESVLLAARRTHPRDVLRFGLPLGPCADFKVGAFWPAVGEGSLGAFAAVEMLAERACYVRWLVATH